MKKILVAYFSASKTTEHAAKEIAQAVGADLYEICPDKAYTAADLNWNDKKSRSTVEMNDPACRPKIAGTVEHMEQYDTVLIGFPIWWYVEPRIVDTFLESYDFSGKTVIPFATSGGKRYRRSRKEPAGTLPEGELEAGEIGKQQSGCMGEVCPWRVSYAKRF